LFFTTFQFYADANEAESWLREKMPLVRSTDCGEDGPGAQALLARHRDLEGQIRAYEGDIQSLNTQADRLVASGVTSLAIGGTTKQQGMVENGSARGEPDGEWGEEIRMVPEEYSEEESCERTEYRTVTEERLVPQVKAIYAFEGQGMTMTKGEVNKLDMMTHTHVALFFFCCVTLPVESSPQRFYILSVLGFLPLKQNQR
jgi:spectrin beta